MRPIFVKKVLIERFDLLNMTVIVNPNGLVIMGRDHFTPTVEFEDLADYGKPLGVDCDSIPFDGIGWATLEGSVSITDRASNMVGDVTTTETTMVLRSGDRDKTTFIIVVKSEAIKEKMSLHLLNGTMTINNFISFNIESNGLICIGVCDTNRINDVAALLSDVYFNEFEI